MAERVEHPDVPESVYRDAATAHVRAEGVNDGYIESTMRDEPFRAGVAVAFAAGRKLAADELRAYAGNYPESVFPPDSDSRDAIGGTAMRHAYRNAARIADEPRPITEGDN